MYKVLLIFFVLLSSEILAQQSAVSEKGKINIPVKKTNTKQDINKLEVNFISSPPLISCNSAIELNTDILSSEGINIIQLKRILPFEETIVEKFGVNKINYNIKKELKLKNGVNKFKIFVLGINQNQKTVYFETVKNIERKDYALIFSVSDYSKIGKVNLPNCSKNADDLEMVLKNRFGFVTQVYKDLTAKEIREKLRLYNQKKYNKDDQLLIYFTGHGKNDGITGYFLCNDGTEISHNDFLTYSNIKNCNHILLVTDACYSGLLSNMADIDAVLEAMYGKTVTEERYKKNTFSKIPSRKVLSSGEKATGSGIDGGNTEFSNDLINVLKNIKSKKYKKTISLSQIIKEIEKINIKQSKSYKAGYFADDNRESDFLFFMK